MKSKYVKFFAIILSLTIVCSSQLTVMASTSIPSLSKWWGYVENEDGTKTVESLVDKTPAEAFDIIKQILSFEITQVGCFLSGTMQDIVLNQTAFDNWYEKKYADGYDGTPWNSAEYFDKEVKRNDDGTFTISDRAMDDFVEYTKEVLDANSGYYLVKTIAKNNIDPSFCFTYKTDYDLFCSKFDESDIFYIYCNSGYWDYADMTGCDFVLYNNNYIRSYKEWVLYKADKLRYSNGEYKDTYSLDYIRITDGAEGIVTEKGSYIKVFKTVDAMKNYQAGYQPYYVGRDFLNYDSNNDNSVTVGGDYFTGNNWYEDNSNYYNDSSTTIINNYGSGITEEQLQDIVDALLEEIKNDRNNGNNNDLPPSDNNKGNGLNSLLDGIGSLFDGVFVILGKLLEYVGKAVEMVTEVITKVIDIIPTNFTNLLTALFPFIPEEMLVCVELLLVLAVILVIVKAVK